MNKKRILPVNSLALVGLLTMALGACTTNQYLSAASQQSRVLSDETIRLHASSDVLDVADARLITANDEAFLAKLELVRNAKTSVDAAYYIFSEDVTSSAFAAELIAAARRGVRVRLLLDYSSAYKDLDMFSMMQGEAGRGSGSLEVRFYNRPTRNIIMDAAYATIGCDAVDTGPDVPCSRAKLAQLRSLFAAEKIDGRPAQDLNISNLNVGSSGIFLSGLYSKQPELMAFAILHGREVPAGSGGLPTISADQFKSALQLASIYWKARTGGPFERLVAKFKLAVVSIMYGDLLDPLYEVVARNLPIARQNLSASVRDWEYVTDYLHQKLLLVDGTGLQHGGRNIEDSYHLTANQAGSGLTFMDTEVLAKLAGDGASVRDAFERLWNFRTMVATVDEIREHAPNEFAANMELVSVIDDECADMSDVDPEACFADAFRARARPLAAREAQRRETLRRNAERFWNEIRPAMNARSPSTIDIDAGSKFFYLENMPFSGNPGEVLPGRTYGAINDREAYSGKRIHALVLAGLEATCRNASAENPQRVIINNAYFFPPSNLVDMLARMLDGRLDCRHVRVTIVTNSRASSDLSVVNLFARHIAFAFTDYLRSIRDADRAAEFEYFEIRSTGGDTHRSLHSKVWLLGDDIVVGSANADVRSYMMDANNALFIRQAPGVIRQYKAMIDSMLDDTSMTSNVSDYYLSTTREQVIEEDRQTFNRMIKSVGAAEKLTPEQLQVAEARFLAVLDLIYDLTLDGLEGRLDSAEKRAAFDRLFKLI